MPTIDRVLETSLYVDDLDRAAAFYRDVLGLTAIVEIPRMVAFDAGGATLLLLFLRGASLGMIDTPSGPLPPHDGKGPVHMAFAVGADQIEDWERHLAEHDIEIESRMRWGRGGFSLYFRDPDGHLLELATPGVWVTY